MAEIPNFPGNSNKSKQLKAEQEEKNLKPIVSQPAVKRKKSIGRKFKEAFIGEESESDSIVDYILYDVLVPAFKDTVSDMIKGSLDMALYGERRPNTRNISRDRGRSYVSYGSYSSTSSRDSRPANRSRRSATLKLNNDDIVLNSRLEAEQVIDRLCDLCDRYGCATLADLYSLVGIDSDPTDNNWGWSDMRMASTSRVRDGYILNLPRVEAL